MNHYTYILIKRAHLGFTDEKELLRCLNEETDPFIKTIINMIIQRKNYPPIEWNTKPFTTEFHSASPRQRLDETFFAFVLSVLSSVKYQSYTRSLRKPESHQALMAWISIFRSILYSGLGLLYNVQWTDVSIMKQLDLTVSKMFDRGDVSALRTLMTNLGITLSQEEPYQAELKFTVLNFLNVRQFGSFFWKYLHWMAEAVSLRNEDANKYKNEWLALLKGPFYRTLTCGNCIHHFKKLMNEHDKELLNYKNFPEVFFKMHNQVNEVKRELYKYYDAVIVPDYDESQYATDSEFMRQALLA